MENKQTLDEVIQSKKIAELLEKHGLVTAIQHDTELNGATIGQAFLLLRGIPDLTTQLTDEVFMATNAVAIKLGAMRHHQQKYEEIQGVRVREISNDENTKNAIQRGIKICERAHGYRATAGCPPEVDAGLTRFTAT